jgi:hypothetical protein
MKKEAKMIRFFTLIVTFTLLVCANAQACLWNGNSNPGSPQAFNRHFSGDKDITDFNSDFESMNSSRFSVDRELESWRRRPGDALPMQGLNGFMRGDVASGDRGRKYHSDVDFNFGERDLYVAIIAMDSGLLEYYFSNFGSGQGEFAGYLWLIAFDGGHGHWGDFIGLLAALLRPPCQEPPIATPLPASAILLASGCAGVLVRRSKVRG